MIDYDSLERLEKKAAQAARKNPRYAHNTKVVLEEESICYLCKLEVPKWMRLNNAGNKYTYSPLFPEIDHVMPITRGGHPWERSNLRLAHRKCNNRKGAKLLSELDMTVFSNIRKEFEGKKKPTRRNILAEIAFDRKKNG